MLTSAGYGVVVEEGGDGADARRCEASGVGPVGLFAWLPLVVDSFAVAQVDEFRHHEVARAGSRRPRGALRFPRELLDDAADDL
jgi:hypothetical protein